MLLSNKSKLFTLIIARSLHGTSIVCKSHYDSLGVHPKATQNDIKSAYYKLSMVYHPDKNQNSEDAQAKFRDITEAYEVLGNFKLRRLYDKGIIHTAGPQYANPEQEVEENPEIKFYQSRQHRSKPPAPSGRTPIYDFDEWSRAHYGELFKKRTQARQRYHSSQSNIEYFDSTRKIEVTVSFIGMFIVALYYFNFLDVNKYDQPEPVVISKESND